MLSSARWLRSRRSIRATARASAAILLIQVSKHTLALGAVLIASAALIAWLVVGSASNPSSSGSSSPGRTSAAHGEARTAPAPDSEPVLEFATPDRDEVDADTFDDLRPPTERELQARALSFEIEVVDSEGRPAPGIRLCLAVDDPLNEQAGWRGSSDRNGRARVSRAFERQRLRTDRLILAPTLARTTPTQLRFPAGAPPSSPVRFQLEPTGSIELVALRRDGAPLDEDVQFELGVSRSLDPERLTPRVCVQERLHAKAGRLIVEHVGLDLEFELFTRSPRMEFASNPFNGPHQPGERVRVERRVSRVRSRVRGRVLDAEGRPLAGVSVVARPGEQREGGEISVGTVWFQATTDAEGAFNAFELIGVTRGHFELRASRAGREVGRAFQPVPSRIANPGAAEDAAFDLGDVQVKPEPLFAAGRVVDSGGQAVREVVIQLRVQGQSDWRGVAFSTDARGRFEIPARVCSVPAALRAIDFDAGEGPEVMVNPGAVDVELSIAALGGIEGELDAPEALLDGELELDAWPSSDAELSERLRYQSAWRIGRFFEFRGLKVGDWNLSVRHHGRVLFERKRIPVRPHDVTSVGLIDLRGKLFALSLHVESASGAELSDGCVQFIDDLGQEHLVTFGRDGEARIVSSTPTRAVLISARAHQSLYAPNASDGTRVTPKPSIQREFAWPAHLAPLPEGREASVQLTYAGPAWVVQARGRVSLRNSFETAFSANVALAGLYDASVTIYGADNAQLYELAPPGATIVIDDQPSDAPLDLPIDPARLERYLRENP